jgi:hypothetical protein
MQRRPDAGEEWTTVACPECGAPSEVLGRAVHGSSAGRVEHLKIRCLFRHWFLLPSDLLDAG